MKFLVLWSWLRFSKRPRETLFKYVSIENSFTVSFFWSHVGMLICGIVLLGFNRRLLKDFIHSIRVNGASIFTLSVVFEGVSAIIYVGDYATLLAPITIVMTLNGYQPVFVLCLVYFSLFFFPAFAKEKSSQFICCIRA